MAQTGTKALEECRPDFFRKERRNFGTSRPKKDRCDLGQTQQDSHMMLGGH